MASKLSRLILASPLLGLSRFPEYVLPVLKLLTHILPNVTLPNKSELGHDILTHDVEKMKAREHDTLMKSQVTIHWVREYLKARALAFQEISKIKIPVSIFQSGDEQVVSRPDTERFYQLLTCQKQIKTYEGFFHELLNEIGRAQVIKEICEYLVSPVR